MGEIKWDYYALKLSLCSLVGFCTATLVPMLLDPLLESNVVWGAREYPLGLWILAPAPVIFVCTYLSQTMTESRTKRMGVPPAVLAGVAFFVFRELPSRVPPYQCVVVDVSFHSVRRPVSPDSLQTAAKRLR